MIIGQLRTWPKISMISNRMRIEASIEKVRKALRESSNKATARGRVDSYSEEAEHQTIDTTNSHAAAHNSDAGSGDELIFLSCRRRSMPDGSFQPLHDNDFYKEQNKRRRFMAQFARSSSKDGDTQPSLFFDSDSDSHPFSPSSPEI
jgi:hypothetical protein